MEKTFALAAEASRAKPPVPHRRADMLGPIHLPLAAPVLGTAAKFAAGLLELRHAEEEARKLGDRSLSTPARDTEAAAAIAALLQAADVRISAARERVRQIKAHIHRNRICAGQQPSADGKAERLFHRIFPEDAPAIPWGYRPQSGERRLPVKAAPPSPAPPRTLADMPVDLLLEKILERPA